MKINLSKNITLIIGLGMLIGCSGDKTEIEFDSEKTKFTSFPVLFMANKDPYSTFPPIYAVSGTPVVVVSESVDGKWVKIKMTKETVDASEFLPGYSSTKYSKFSYIPKIGLVDTKPFEERSVRIDPEALSNLDKSVIYNLEPYAAIFNTLIATSECKAEEISTGFIAKSDLSGVWISCLGKNPEKYKRITFAPSILSSTLYLSKG